MMKNKIEAIYPLSPMQQGMLFHYLDNGYSEIYFEQVNYILQGNLDVEGFKKAWQQVMDRHAILRTLFTWENLEKPIQLVQRQVECPWAEQDWRQCSQEDQQEKLKAFLQADRERGFQLKQAPLLRLNLIRIAQDTYHFTWSFHHLILDGWSVSLILGEVFAIYEASQQGQDIHLQTSRPYRDYISWLQQQDLSKAEKFWRQALKGSSPPTRLKVDRATASESNQRGGYNEQEIKLSRQTTSALQLLAQQYQLTLNTVVQGAWALLLSRYSGEEDVVFGAVVSGRPATLAGADSMVGLFINTLPVRGQVSPEKELIPWLKELQVQQGEALQYEYSPLVQVQRWSDVPAGQPLFESILAFENYPEDAFPLEENRSLQLQRMPTIARTNYPLTVAIEPEKELRLTIIYDCSRFDATFITSLLGHFQALLEGMVANPQQHLSDLPLLTAAERQQLLVEWNATRTDYPEACVHELFEAQVQQKPEDVAVIWQDRQLTYQQLNQQANQLAHHLQRLGIGPEAPVGLYVERSLEMVVGLLGILKAGGVYVPLDPAYPQERLAFMLEDAQVPVLLTQQRLAGGLPPHTARVVCLDTDGTRLSRESQENPTSGVRADNLAYVIYTSGSTGRPKGVAVSHRAINRLVFHTNYVQLEPTDRVAQASNASFDAATFEIWGALLQGAQLIGIEKEVALSPQDFAAQLQEQGISVLFLTTALFNQLASNVPSGFRSVRHLLFGGEAVDPKWVKEVLNHGRPERLLHVYGPTESTTFSTWYVVQEVPEEATTIPIGYPISNTQMYLLDAYLQPGPVGVPGELYSGGGGLARCYLNRPELTAERFLPHPWSSEPGARLYKTGDQARYLPDGSIEFLGRLDQQVKLRGYRIELGEIEAVLSQHPAVGESLVLIREEVLGDKRLVAYVVAHSQQEISGSDLRNFLQAKLPDYMVPSAFVLMDAWPLTPNGKIDRHALPVPDGARSTLDSTYVAPRNPVEEVLAGIWARGLGGEQVALHDNFFELGGHSLLAIQIIWRVREALQVDLPISSLFETPTLEQFAQRITTIYQTTQGVHVAPIEPILRPAVLPLSFAQQRLWFLDQWEPNSPLYNVPLAMRLNGSLQLTVLEQSLNEIIRRHESLRTTFATVEGQPVQVIAPSLSLELLTVDLSAVALLEQESEVQRLTSDEAQRPFDLTRGPLLRAQVLRLSERVHVLQFTMHHIISDGWSMEVLFQELSALYAAYATGQPSPLPQLPIQYADFSLWQRQWLQGEELEGQLAYWQQHLVGAPAVLELPTDRPRPAVQTFRGASHYFELSKRLSQGLKRLSQGEGVSLFMTLLAAFQTLLLRYTGQPDLVIGSPIANRTRAEIEGLIGFFVNTLALRTDLSGDPSFRELLRRVRQVALGAYVHQDVPFERVVEAVQPERNLSHSPLFQVFFALNQPLNSSLVLGEVMGTFLEVESGMAKFDLMLSLIDDEQGLIGELLYNTDLFEAATVARMAQHFETLVEGIVANPERHLSDLPLLTASERQQLLVEWNATSRAYLQDQCIHELFQAQVERTPEALALIWGGKQLSYKQLNQQANQLAHYLRKHGVGPEVRVGLCMERSLEMVVGLFGILKAGGAYVPLDPSYPAERLAFVLQDAQIPLLLTQQRLLAQLPEVAQPVVCLDSDWASIASASEQPLHSGVSGQNLAYVIYTSGSTGQPKGAMILHHGLLNYLHWCRRAYQV